MFNILIVDDEKKERDGIETLIAKSHFDLRVIKANNGEDALSRMADHKIDILLTDIKMPFMDGISLIQKLKDRRGEIFLILYSAYADFEYAQSAISLGVSKYLLKPINMDDFYEVMTEAIIWCREKQEKESEELEIRRIVENSKYYTLEKQIYLLLNSAISHSKALDKIYELVASFRTHHFIPISVCGEASDLIEVIEGVKSKASRQFEFVYSLLDPNTFLICLFLEQNNDQRHASEFGDMLLQTIQQQLQSTAFIIVGRELEHLKDLKAEYEIMSKYAEYFYFVSTSTIVYVQQDEQIMSSHDVMQISIEKITTCVNVNNFSEAYTELDRMQAQINNNRSYSQIFVKYILTEMIKKISQNTSLNIKPADLVNSIYATENLKDTMHVIKNILKKIEAKQQNSLMQSRIIRTVRDLITQGYNRNEMGLSFLADQVQVTPAYLSTLFKKETGQNITKFIADYRIEQAKYLLKTTKLKVAEIGEQVGFPNSSYFISIFRNKENISPAQYRERA